MKVNEEDQKKIFDWIKNGKNFLIYQGVAGCGKTYFCYAIENDAKIFGEFKFIRQWKEATFFERIRMSIDRGCDFNSEVEYLMDDDLIIYDDLCSANINDWRSDILFTFINLRYLSTKPTVITTNLTDLEIKDKLGYRIYSRLFAKENTILNFGETDLRKEGM